MNEAVFFALSVLIAAILIGIAGMALSIYNSATAKLAAYVELRDAQPTLIAYKNRIYVCYGFEQPANVVFYNVRGQGWDVVKQLPKNYMQTPRGSMIRSALSEPYVYCGWVDVHDIPANITVVLSYNGVTVVQKYQLSAVALSTATTTG